MFTNLQSTLPDISKYSNDDLILLRDRINLRLDDLTSINLEQELVNQLTQVKELLRDAYQDDEQSGSQKAALINSCSAIMRDLAKTQGEIHNAERVKLQERCLIDCLADYPDVSRPFLDAYEKMLEDRM